MEVLNDLGLRGKVGNLVFYRVGDKRFVRRARARLRKDYKPRTEAQVGLQRRFQGVQRMYSYLRNNVFGDAWTLAGRAEGKRGNAMFHAANCGCFDAEGRLVEPSSFRFMEGKLLLPRELKVERGEDGWWRVTWEDERVLSTAAGTDELVVAVGDSAAEWVFYGVEEVRGRREDGEGWFRPEEFEGPEVYAHVYFRRADGTAYSPSRCFRLDAGGEGKSEEEGVVAGEGKTGEEARGDEVAGEGETGEDGK